ncbi:MAG: 50S ribosomal protein L25/general stress protein Ctc [Pseudomonadota bacterium]
MSVLSVQERNSESPRELRLQGNIPGIVYGGSAPARITLNGKELSKAYENVSYYTGIIQLQTGKAKEDVLAKAVQLDPVTDRIIHADFMRVNKEMRIRVRVPVRFINEEKSIAIKRGGVLNIIVHALEVKCSPYQIPSELVYDLSGVGMTDQILLEKLKLSKDVTPVNAARNRILATIVAPTSGNEPTAAEAAEGTTA